MEGEAGQNQCSWCWFFFSCVENIVFLDSAYLQYCTDGNEQFLTFPNGLKRKTSCWNNDELAGLARLRHSCSCWSVLTLSGAGEVASLKEEYPNAAGEGCSCWNTISWTQSLVSVSDNKWNWLSDSHPYFYLVPMLKSVLIIGLFAWDRLASKDIAEMALWLRGCFPNLAPYSLWIGMGLNSQENGGQNPMLVHSAVFWRGKHSTACPMALRSVPGFVYSSDSKQRSCSLCMCNALTYLFESYKNVPRKSLELPFPVLRSCSAAAPTSGMESWLSFVGFYLIYWFLFDLKGNSFFGIENSSHSVNYNPWLGVAASYFSCLEPKWCGVCVLQGTQKRAVLPQSNSRLSVVASCWICSPL